MISKAGQSQHSYHNPSMQPYWNWQIRKRRTIDENPTEKKMRLMHNLHQALKQSEDHGKKGYHQNCHAPAISEHKFAAKKHQDTWKPTPIHSKETLKTFKRLHQNIEDALKTPKEYYNTYSYPHHSQNHHEQPVKITVLDEKDHPVSVRFTAAPSHQNRHQQPNHAVTHAPIARDPDSLQVPY